MDDAISILLFCHTLDSRLRQLLRLMKVLLEFGLSRHAARDCGLAGLGIDLMVLVFFCYFF